MIPTVEEILEGFIEAYTTGVDEEKILATLAEAKASWEQAEREKCARVYMKKSLENKPSWGTGDPRIYLTREELRDAILNAQED